MISYFTFSEQNRDELKQISEHFIQGYQECCTGWDSLCRLVVNISTTAVSQPTAEKIGRLLHGLGWTALVLLTPTLFSLSLLGLRTIVQLQWESFSQESQSHMYTGVGLACGLTSLSHAAQSLMHPLYAISAAIYGVASWYLCTRKVQGGI